MLLIVASNNPGKIREFKEILEPLGYTVRSQREMGIDIEVEETGTSFAENAHIKATAIYNACHEAVIADDSGLMVRALGGKPGVHSHRYAGENATDAERCQKILDELSGVPDSRRQACFVTDICMIAPNGKRYTATGVCEGYIGHESLGENGFGYDPIFMVDGVSFAQMSAEEKNKLSHRARALMELKNKLESE